MAINEVLFPTVPNPVIGDWALAIELVEHAYKNIYNPVQFSGSNVVVGAVFQVGGHVYHTDGATAITGTSSDYVKLTITGTTLVPSFVADLTGVTWSSLWGGYYDGTGNLYIFDEVKAILAGDLVGGSSKFAELWNNNFDQRLKTTDTPQFAGATLYDQVTNADRNIEFASDADLLWDESEDEFYMNKDLKVAGFVSNIAKSITSDNYMHEVATLGDLYDRLALVLLSIGDSIQVSGGIGLTTSITTISRAYRSDSTHIVVQGTREGTSFIINFNTTSSDTTNASISLSW